MSNRGLLANFPHVPFKREAGVGSRMDAKVTAAAAEPRPRAGKAGGAAPWRSAEVSFNQEKNTQDEVFYGL